MDFYYLPRSLPCRAVLMTAKALGLEMNKIVVDTSIGEQMKPEFLRINPQHTIPTLVDGDFVLWESRAIMIYLVEKYGKQDHPLYPSCPKKRALINQRLYFDMGTLLKSFAAYLNPQIWQNKSADPELYRNLEIAVEFLNAFLGESDYVAGDTMTLADLALLATISTIEMVDFDFSKFEKVKKWYAKMKGTAPGADENWTGCLEWKNHKYLEERV